MTTQYVGNNRLLKLADYLEELPPSYLDMDSWVSANGGYCSIDLTDKQKQLLITNSFNEAELPTSVKKVRDCGFAACAVGWAGTIKSFKRAGFSVGQEREGDWFLPRFDGESGPPAICKFFAIDDDDVEHLFMPSEYEAKRPRPTTVAKRIRKVVEKRQKATA